MGHIDVLVNNAGIETIVPFLELTDEQWTRLVDVNLRGEWLCSQVFCRRVVQEGRKGNIVNIGSIQAAKILPGRTHYAPAKLAIEALTRNMSAEMTPLGHPGELCASGLDRHGYDGLGNEAGGFVARHPGTDLGGTAGHASRDRLGSGVLCIRGIELSHRPIDSCGRRLGRKVILGEETSDGYDAD